MSKSNRQIALLLAGTETKIIPRKALGSIDPYIEWIKWLSYIPKFEKNRVEEISKKAAGELSMLELDELKDYLSKKRILSLFKIYGTQKISKSEYMEVYDYMSENSINKLMLSKLSKEELEYANSVIEQYKKIPIDELRIKVHNDQKEDVYLSLSMVDSYILHILSNFNFSKSIDNLNREITAKCEENNATRQKSYKYSSNQYK